ncbi:MAG TPA: hypothetical protein VJK03_03040 [Candidatus Nanoarchaeia archaeon]|nr:hypothetical protein [Candidatus Nanoarchaeia archaeon]
MGKRGILGDTRGQVTPMPVVPGPVLPGAAPAARLPTNIKWIIVAIAFVAVVVLEIIGGKALLFATVILLIFGFFHVFARGPLAKIILGGIPLLLAAVSLPEVFGGSGFGDFFGKIPLLGWISPNNWPGWAIRYAILAGVLLYYHHFLRNILLQYARMGKAAGGAAASGVGYAWKHFSLGRIIAWIIVVGAIYGLDNYSKTFAVNLGGEYGPMIVSVALAILGLVFLFRKSFAFRLLGAVSLLLGLAGFGTLLPYVDQLFKNEIMQNFVPGETHFFRYGVIAVIVFYFLFHGKAWAQQQVT